MGVLNPVVVLISAIGFALLPIVLGIGTVLLVLRERQARRAAASVSHTSAQMPPDASAIMVDPDKMDRHEVTDSVTGETIVYYTERNPSRQADIDLTAKLIERMSKSRQTKEAQRSEGA